MRADSIARRYARALFELAEEHGTLEATAASLATTSELLGDARVARVLTGPVPRENKSALLRTIADRAGAPPAFRDFLLLLADHHRLGHLAAMRTAFDGLVDVSARRTRAAVRTATQLSPDMVDEIARVFAGVTGKQVLPEVTVVPELLAGVVVEVEGRVYDGSLRTQLAKLRERMATGG